MECTLYLTDDCNLKCSYCYEGHDKLHSRISQATLEKAIDFMVSVNEDEEIELNFLGGEPMLNKKMMYHAVQYIKDSYEIPFRYSITTNGTCCEREDIDFMFQNNFEISLSVDGKKETHILNRHVKSKQSDEELYDKIIDNLKYMVNEKIPFTVRMTVTCNNVHHFYENVQYFWELGVRRFDIAFNEFEIWSVYYLQLLEQELQRLDVFYLSNPGEIESINLYDGKMTFFIAKRELRFCSAGRKSHFVINSKGEFYPCNYVCNQELWKMGTLDTVFSEKLCFSHIKENITNDNKCQLCEIAYACIGARCGFKNYCLSGELNVPNDNLCNLEKVLYKHNDLVFQEMFYLKDKRFMRFYEIAKKENFQLTDWMIEVVESVGL